MLIIRLASLKDAADIKALMTRSIEELQQPYLSQEQIKASHAAMGLDTQLIEDGTYFCVMLLDRLVGCGGWSFRSTLYGGNHSVGRNIARLDPAKDRARIRAMYAHPDYARRGIGKMIIEASETAAREAGFIAVEMAATLAGEPFYRACGYHVESRWEDHNSTVPIPLLTMVKSLAP